MLWNIRKKGWVQCYHFSVQSTKFSSLEINMYDFGIAVMKISWTQLLKIIQENPGYIKWSHSFIHTFFPERKAFQMLHNNVGKHFQNVVFQKVVFSLYSLPVSFLCASFFSCSLWWTLLFVQEIHPLSLETKVYEIIAMSLSRSSEHQITNIFPTSYNNKKNYN